MGNKSKETTYKTRRVKDMAFGHNVLTTDLQDWKNKWKSMD